MSAPTPIYAISIVIITIVILFTYPIIFFWMALSFAFYWLMIETKWLRIRFIIGKLLLSDRFIRDMIPIVLATACLIYIFKSLNTPKHSDERNITARLLLVFRKIKRNVCGV